MKTNKAFLSQMWEEIRYIEIADSNLAIAYEQKQKEIAIKKNEQYKKQEKYICLVFSILVAVVLAMTISEMLVIGVVLSAGILLLTAGCIIEDKMLKVSTDRSLRI